MKKYDPYEIFINSFGRRITKKDVKIDFDPLTTRCALLDNCFCSKDCDCAATQICTSLPGYNYTVCKTKNEVPEVQFDRSIFPDPGGWINWVLTVVPTLVTAVLAKCPILGLVDTVPDVLVSALG